MDENRKTAFWIVLLIGVLMFVAIGYGLAHGPFANQTTHAATPESSDITQCQDLVYNKVQECRLSDGTLCVVVQAGYGVAVSCNWTTETK